MTYLKYFYFKFYFISSIKAQIYSIVNYEILSNYFSELSNKCKYSLYEAIRVLLTAKEQIELMSNKSSLLIRLLTK